MTSSRWLRTRLHSLAAHFARALPGHSTLETRRAQGRPGADLAPAVRCAKDVAQRDRTAAYRWCQSLGLPCAMVGRLMPCSPGSRTFLLASLTPRIDDAVRPVGLAHIFAKGLTVATTARTTRFCRTHGPPFRRSFPGPRRQSRKLTDETSLAAPFVRTRPRAHRDYPPLLAPSVPTLPRPPQARLANKTTTRSPLKDEPGWATHTPFPNFGKVEYFCANGLTRARHRQDGSKAIQTTPPQDLDRPPFLPFLNRLESDVTDRAVLEPKHLELRH
ncbi:hypothetical protein GGD63_004617 [Bradyrhizobium sp. cir1]|nr:hypothetical protein [Bradyrhizobium sp. cir1]